MRSTRLTRVLLCLLLGAVVTACSGAPATTHHGKAAPVVPPTVLPTAGGTLRVVTSAPVVWRDTNGVPTAAAAELSRLSSRQLVSLDGVDSLGDRADPIADLTPFAEVSGDKLALTFRLRDVRYAPPYSGTLKPADVVFGLELLCDPAHPDADADLLSAALVGYADFCAGMRALPDGEAGVKAYADSHPVAGLAVTAADTVTMRLTRPEGDLLDILTLPDMTPFPEAYFDPASATDSWVQAPALGPYLRIATGTSFTFRRNPVWDATQDPLRRAWADSVTVTAAASPARARAAVDAGSADVLLDTSTAPGEQMTLPTVPASETASTSVLRTTPAGDMLTLVPLRAVPGACAAALAQPAVRQALVIGVDHRPLTATLGGALLADARDWPIPAGVIGGIGAPPVTGRAAGADGPGTVAVPVAAAGASAGLGGDPGQARQLLASAGVSTLACSLSAVNPETGAPDPGLVTLLPAVAAGLKAVGVSIRIVTSGASDLALERLTSQWRGDGAANLLAPLINETTDPVVEAAVQRAEGEADQTIAATRWGAVATLLSDDGDLVPLAEQRVQSLTSGAIRGFRWYGPGNSIDLANAALAGG